MCFRNLPIEFDDEGNARLRGPADDAWSVRAPLRTPMRGHAPWADELLGREDSDMQLHVDNATRIAGDFAIDLHDVLELVERGCPPDLAVRIAAPLDWPG